MVPGQQEGGLQRFGHAVALGEAAAEGLHGPLQHGWGGGAATVEDGAQAGKVVGGEARVVDDGVDHGGDEDRDRDCTALDRLEPECGIEPVVDHLRAAKHEVRDHHAHRPHVVEGSAYQIDVGGPAVVDESLVVAVGLQVQMGDHGSLGISRCPTGVEDGKRVIFSSGGDGWICRRSRQHSLVAGLAASARACLVTPDHPDLLKAGDQTHEFGRLVRVLLGRNDDPGLGGGHDLTQFRHSQPVAERQRDQAGARGSKKHLRILQAVAQEYGHSVLRSLTGRPQRVGHTVHPLVHLLPGADGIAHDEARLVRVAQRIAPYELVESPAQDTISLCANGDSHDTPQRRTSEAGTGPEYE